MEVDVVVMQGSNRGDMHPLDMLAESVQSHLPCDDYQLLPTTETDTLHVTQFVPIERLVSLVFSLIQEIASTPCMPSKAQSKAKSACLLGLQHSDSTATQEQAAATG